MYWDKYIGLVAFMGLFIMIDVNGDPGLSSYPFTLIYGLGQTQNIRTQCFVLSNVKWKKKGRAHKVSK